MNQTTTLRIGRSALVAAALAGAVTLTGAAPAANAATTGTETLGPFGYGNIRLGMTEAKARGTGRIVRKTIKGDITCSAYDFKNHRYEGNRAGLFISKKQGVVTISSPGKVKTPQGFGWGSTPAQLRAAYPNLKKNAMYGTYATVPGNPKAIYVFVSSKNMVLGVTLVMTAQTCLR